MNLNTTITTQTPTAVTLTKELTSENSNGLAIENILHNPLNYMGGKGRLLSQILPFLPSKINHFYDVFGGAFTMGINVQAEQITYNERDKNVHNVIKALSEDTPQNNFDKVLEIINEYQLSENKKENLHKLVDDFNGSEEKPWYMFYPIVMNSYSSQIEYKKDGNLRVKHNDNNSFNNPSLQSKFIAYATKLSESTNINYKQGDYSYIKDLQIEEGDFFYFDPPYLIADAAYNRSWKIEDEIKLYATIDEVDKKGGKFALSNVFEMNGVPNEILLKWAKDNNYNIIYLDKKYKTASAKNQEKPTVEVLITNYGNSYEIEIPQLLSQSKSIIQGQMIDYDIPLIINEKFSSASSKEIKSQDYLSETVDTKIEEIFDRFAVGMNYILLKAQCKGIKGSYESQVKKFSMDIRQVQKHMLLVKNDRIYKLTADELRKINNLSYTKLLKMARLSNADIEAVLRGDDTPLKKIKEKKESSTSKTPQGKL